MDKLTALLMTMIFITAFAIKAEELRDPTQPHRVGNASAGNAGNTNSYKVSTILYSAHEKKAVINGYLLKEKDWLGNAFVQSIQPHSVELVKDGDVITLELVPLHIRAVEKTDKDERDL